MISEFFQIKSNVEAVENDSRKVCYLCLPKSQWITNNQKDLIENKLEEMELENE